MNTNISLIYSLGSEDWFGIKIRNGFEDKKCISEKKNNQKSKDDESQRNIKAPDSLRNYSDLPGSWHLNKKLKQLGCLQIVGGQKVSSPALVDEIMTRDFKCNPPFAR